MNPLAWFLARLRGERTIPATAKTCGACRIWVPASTPVQANGERFCPRCTGQVGAYRVGTKLYCPDPVCLHAALVDSLTMVPVAFETLPEDGRCETCGTRLLDA